MKTEKRKVTCRKSHFIESLEQPKTSQVEQPIDLRKHRKYGIPEENGDIYLTRFEVAKIFKITLTTLNKWTKKGVIPSCKIGYRILYKSKDIYRSLPDKISVEQPKEVEGRKTAEEILRDELSDHYWEIITKQDEEGHATFKDWIIEAMHEYHSQFSAIDLKEELVAFNGFMCGNQYDGRIPLIDTCIDEYLSTRPDVKKVSDEMIEEAAKDHIRYTYTPITKREVVELLISFAKALRDNKIN